MRVYQVSNFTSCQLDIGAFGQGLPEFPGSGLNRRDWPYTDLLINETNLAVFRAFDTFMFF